MIVLALLLFKRNPFYLVWAGLICLLIAIPLFAKYIFFTAEHLTWYAAVFFLVAIVLFLVHNKRHMD